MADLYWNPPSVPANFSDGSNWRENTVSGPVYGAAPTSVDSINFVSTGSPRECTFDTNVNVTSFTANDSGPDASFVLAPAFVNAIQITVTVGFDVRAASSLQKAFFSLWSTLNDAPVVTVRSNLSASGTASFALGDTQMGTIAAVGATTGTTVLSTSSGFFSYPIKCYYLDIQSGTVELSPESCTGAEFGPPTNTSSTRIAVRMAGASYKRLRALFEATQPITLYANFIADNPGFGLSYDLVWRSDTRIYAKGPATSLTINAGPVIGPFPQQPRQLPFIYNYLGENASGAAVSNGGVLVIGGISSGVSGDCKVMLYGLTCTAAGSVSGLYSRAVQLSVQSTRNTWLQILSGISPTFVMEGSPVSGREVAFTSSQTPFQGKFEYFNPADPTAQALHTFIKDINAQAIGPTLYIAYTDDGNINGGGNTNWVFEQSRSGFLAFFF